ncbi:MAG TPA: glycosyltransferase family 4 protein [Terriglobales bacterium]|nr:glycosyltransferase family 4 protein [Terriglobales bacterium]
MAKIVLVRLDHTRDGCAFARKQETGGGGMNVLLLSHMFPNPLDPCAGIFVLEQAKAMRASGINLQVVSPMPWAPRVLRFYPSVRKYSVVPACWEVDDFVVQYPRVPTLPKNLGFSISGVLLYLSCRSLLAKLLRKEPVNVIHAHTLLPDGFAAILLGREFGVPVICTAHGSDVNVYPSRSRPTRWATQWALRHADHVITVSENLKAEALALATPRDISAVRNGATTANFHPYDRAEARSRLNLDPLGRMVTFIGYLRPEKGIEFLLEAFAGLQRRDTSLCVVGDGPLRDSLIARVKQLGIADNCVFAGKRPHSEIPLWISGSDCVVLPSLSEGFPTILPEVMLCGVPIIATAVGGIPEAIWHGETGLLVPSRDSSAITKSLANILSDEQLASRIANRARDMAKRSLTWEANARRMIDVYENVVRQADPCAITGDGRSGLQSVSIH